MRGPVVLEWHLYDDAVNPGWFDWLGLAIALVGFGVTIYQVVKTRSAAKAATAALTTAQGQLAKRALLAIGPQLQSIQLDLGYTMKKNNADIAERTLVRFGLIAREASGLLITLGVGHEDLAERMRAAAHEATVVKAAMSTTKSPDVVLLAKAISAEVDALTQDVMDIANDFRNTIEGAKIAGS